MTEPAQKIGTVLLVDDDPVIATMYGLELERAGYRVVVAKDGKAGLELASSSKPDLILLDVRMPRLNGLEMLTRLAADSATAEIPVVMLSNRSEMAIAKAAIGLGAKEFLVKIQNTPPEVAAVVARCLAAVSQKRR